MSSKQHTAKINEEVDTSGVQSVSPGALQSQQTYGNAFLAEQLNASTDASSLSTDG